MRTERRLSHIALRLLIERMFGARWRGVPYSRAPAGKLRLADLEGDFSLSHGHGRALIGLSASGCIGVDMEALRDVTLAAERRERIVRAAAGLVPDRCLPEVEPARFLQAWVRLEALGKSDGQGLGSVLDRLGAWHARGAADQVGAGDAGFEVHDLALGKGLFGAAALSREPAHALPRGVAAGTVRALPHGREAILALLGLPRGCPQDQIRH